MKLDVAGLVQLAASGNSKTVEELWMAALDDHTGDPDEIASWVPLLSELANRGRAEEAEPLAWAAIQAIQENVGPRGSLKVACPFLLVLNESDDLKEQVAGLYAEAYADREHLDTLLDEAGVAGTRPPRRALRTLDVALNIEPGSYLAARHEDEAARVVSIEAETWEATIETSDGRRTLGPVELADEFAITDANDFRVLRQFAPDDLQRLAEDDPAALVIGVLRANGDHIDSNALAELLVPAPVSSGAWTKWWSKTRAALKRHPNVRVNGRAPYELSLLAEAVTVESETETRFRRLHDPLERVACVEAYLRECRAIRHTPDAEMLGRLRTRAQQSAQRSVQLANEAALTALLAARAVAVLTGVVESEADRPVVEHLAAASDPAGEMRRVIAEPLWPAACRCLQTALPDRYLELCETLLPEAPTGACDVLARDLKDGGFDRAGFDRLIQTVMKEPARHVSALAWLWHGPDAELNLSPPPLPALCSKLVAVASDIRRRDDLDRDAKKRMLTCIRDALSTDRYRRFKECLAQTEAGVAHAWRTRIARLDNLGRAVPEDLAKLIHTAFPQERSVPERSPWKREDVIYMTDAGRRRLSEAIDDLVNVKMRENAKAIGEAASHGDLSENSEYKFALEERDLLRARLAQLQEQHELAEVLEADDVPEDHIGFGACVTLRREDNGTALQLTFLGPWESDTDQAIYNYRTPVGQKLMGLVRGQTVDLEIGERPGSYVVEQIENALLEQGRPA